MRNRRGAALVMMLAAAMLIGSLSLLGLHTTAVRVRLMSDARWRIEGSLVIGSALAASRIAHRGDLDSLADGAQVSWPVVVRPDGWSWSAAATRSGATIRLSASAMRRAADGTVFAARRASLLLARVAADTVRVLARRARF